jgi:PilZ domain
MQLALPVRVLCRETADHEWVEMSRLRDVTPFGARFTLKRPIEIGRLLHLTLPMPRPLRVFDHVEDQYRVWCLVRNLKLLDPAKEKGALVEVGVAFIGKRPPRNFAGDPSRRYDIAQSAGEMLWSVKDDAAGPLLVNRAATYQQRETRHTIPVEVFLEVFDESGALSQKENTVTENLSRHGASIFTTLTVSRGRFVKISCDTFNVSLLAVVRGSRAGADGISRLHLEFIGSEWPLET